MEPNPRRGRLRRWAALLAALASMGGAWVRRALRHRLARRRAGFFVKQEGRGGQGGAANARAGTARGPGEEDTGPSSDPSAPQGDHHRGRSSSAMPRRFPDAPTASGPGEDAAPSNPSAAQEDRRGSSSSSARTQRIPVPEQEDHGHGHGEGMNVSSGENTGRDNNPSAPEGHEPPRATAGAEKTKDAITGHTPASPPSLIRAALFPDPEEKSPEHGDAHERGAGEGATATPGADRVAHGWCSAGERTQPQQGAVTRSAAPDSPPGGADAAVLVQPDLAASSRANRRGKEPRSGSSARRRRQLVPRNNKKAKGAAPRQAEPLLQIDQWEEDEIIMEDDDYELQMHESYRIKAAACTKGYFYCLMCHLNNKEKKLAKDVNKVTHHCESAHQCKSGGISCEWTGCYVRAKHVRDMGLHQYVRHKL